MQVFVVGLYRQRAVALKESGLLIDLIEAVMQLNNFNALHEETRSRAMLRFCMFDCLCCLLCCTKGPGKSWKPRVPCKSNKEDWTSPKSFVLFDITGCAHRRRCCRLIVDCSRLLRFVDTFICAVPQCVLHRIGRIGNAFLCSVAVYEAWS